MVMPANAPNSASSRYPSSCSDVGIGRSCGGTTAQANEAARAPTTPAAFMKPSRRQNERRFLSIADIINSRGRIVRVPRETSQPIARRVRGRHIAPLPPGGTRKTTGGPRPSLAASSPSQVAGSVSPCVPTLACEANQAEAQAFAGSDATERQIRYADNGCYVTFVRTPRPGGDGVRRVVAGRLLP